MVICPISVLAATREVSIDVGDEYIFAYSGDKLDSIADTVGMTSDELGDYFEQNGVLFLAADKDNSMQIRISSYENEFAELVGNLSALDDNEITQVADVLSGDENGDFRIFKGKKYVFILFTEQLTDSGGDYISQQYITVFGGKIYRISVYMPSDKGTFSFDTIVDTFEINESKTPFPLWLTVLFVLGIAVFASVAVVMVIGIVKERRKSKNGNGDENEDI